VVGLVLVVRLEVVVVLGRVDGFGDRVAGLRTGHAADHRADDGTDRSGNRADGRAGHATGHCAGAFANAVILLDIGHCCALLVWGAGAGADAVIVATKRYRPGEAGPCSALTSGKRSGRSRRPDPRDVSMSRMHRNEDWDLVMGDGPVIATAIHDGHAIRDSLQPYLAIDAATRRREEDPMTGFLTEAGDIRIRVRRSRFEADLNRPRNKAVARDPEDTWGLQVWRGELPRAEVERSLAYYDRFHDMIARLID